MRLHSPRSRLQLVLAVLSSLLVSEGSGKPLPEGPARRKLPPALVLKTGPGKDSNLLIPLPCQDRICTALLFRLATLGKIPWYYVFADVEEEAEEEAALLAEQELEQQEREREEEEQALFGASSTSTMRRPSDKKKRSRTVYRF